MYYRGEGVPQDYQKALRWFLKGADERWDQALYAAGYMYHEAIGVEQDYKKAMEYYRLAAEQGYAPAHFGIGRLYESQSSGPRLS